MPEDGVYTEIIPKRFRNSCLYDGKPDSLSSRIQDFWHLHPDEEGTAEVAFLDAIKGFDAIAACKAMDERLSTLVARHPDGR